MYYGFDSLLTHGFQDLKPYLLIHPPEIIPDVIRTFLFWKVYRMFKDKPLILIAECDPFVRDILKESLEERFEIEFVGDGMEVLERVMTTIPDIIVLEILLPTLDGLQVCSRLKSDPSTKNIPVLFFSLLAAEERVKQVGADGFLLKPFRKKDFFNAIDGLIDSGFKRER